MNDYQLGVIIAVALLVASMIAPDLSGIKRELARIADALEKMNK